MNDPERIALGVDIGGTKILGVALGEEGQVLAESRVATPREAAEPGSVPVQGVAQKVAQAVLSVVTELTGKVADVRPPGATGTPTGASGGPDCLGIGVPGLVDTGGVLRFAPNLSGATGSRLGALVGAQLGALDVLVENDANCAALAEHRLGSARGSDDFVMVTLGTGIGGGLFIGGRLHVGSARFAGEIGHMVVDPSGPACPCGGRGCWERYASGAGLGRLAREAANAGRLHAVTEAAGGDPEMVRAEHVTGAAVHGDVEALAVLEELGWWVGLGLANLTAAVDPGRIVIGGGLAEVGELLLEPTRRAYASLVEGGSARPPMDIVRAAFGERSGAVGAALAARDRVVR